jgi:transcriptional regulator with XRE-family HTH domain
MGISICNSTAVFHVGDVIRKLRRERKWKVEQLARAAGVAKMTVSAIERGANYRRDTIDQLAAALGTTVAEMYKGAGGAGETTTVPALPRLQELLDQWAAISDDDRALILRLMAQLPRAPRLPANDVRSESDQQKRNQADETVRGVLRSSARRRDR